MIDENFQVKEILFMYNSKSLGKKSIEIKKKWY